MLLTALFGVLLVAVASGLEAVPYGPPRPGQVRARIAGAAAKVRSLEERVSDLEDGAERARNSVKVIARRARAVASRALNLEHIGYCDENRDFMCGGSERRCISDLLVCDGKADCTDGQDEDEDLCTSPVPVGTVLVGSIDRRNRGGCGGSISEIRISIIWTQRQSWFQSRQKVKAAITLTDSKGGDMGAVVRGYYNYRMRTLVLVPMQDVSQKLGFSCTFDGVRDDRCGAAARFADLKPCMMFGMRKES